MRDRSIKKKSNCTFNRVFGVEAMETRQPSLVDAFTHEIREDAQTGVDTYTYHHPLYMLFNQQRLDRLGEGAIQMWLKQLDAAGNSSREQLKSKISDSDLLKTIKPRNIQCPADLEKWIAVLNERADVFNAEVAKIVAEEKEKAEQQQQQAEQQQQQQVTNTQSS